MSAGEVDGTLDAFFREEDWLYRLARRLVRDDASARDLVQEVWTAALENPPPDTSQPRSWLSTVLRRIAAKQRAKLRPVLGETLEGHASGERLPEEAVERWEARRRLRDAVDALEPELRTTVLLRYQEGLLQERIARELSISERSVRNRLTNARGRIKRQLARGAHAGGAGGDRSWALVLLPLLRREDLAALRRAASAAPVSTLPLLAKVAAGAALAALGLVLFARLLEDGRGATRAGLTPAGAAAPNVVAPRPAAPDAGADARVALAEPTGTQTPTEVVSTAAAVTDSPPALGSVATLTGTLLLDGVAPTGYRAWLRPAVGELRRVGAHCVAPIGSDGSFAVGADEPVEAQLYLEVDQTSSELVAGSPAFLVRRLLTPGVQPPPVHVAVATAPSVRVTLDEAARASLGEGASLVLHLTDPEWEYLSTAPLRDGQYRPLREARFRQVPEGPVVLRRASHEQMLSADWTRMPVVARLDVVAGQSRVLALRGASLSVTERR